MYCFFGSAAKAKKAGAPRHILPRRTAIDGLEQATPSSGVDGLRSRGVDGEPLHVEIRETGVDGGPRNSTINGSSNAACISADENNPAAMGINSDGPNSGGGGTNVGPLVSG